MRSEEQMPNFIISNPEQSSLLPVHVRDVLPANHVVFLIHEVMGRQDLREFTQAYGEEGQSPYHPAMMLEILLYARCLGLRSVRKIEQRVREDLGFRYLAGGCQPDFVSFNRFRLRHGEAIKKLFTQVTTQLLLAGVTRLGKVVIDSTRVKSNTSEHTLVSKRKLQEEQARLEKEHQRWLQRLSEQDPEEDPGGVVENLERVRERLAAIPMQVEQIEQSGEKVFSCSDPDSRNLRARGGFVHGYTAEVVVSDEHFIVGQRVTQSKADNHALIPLIDQVEQQYGARVKEVIADSGFYSNRNVDELERRGIEVYVPDSNLARELNGWGAAPPNARDPGLRHMRKKLRSRAGRKKYRRRQAVVEPVIGILKEQMGIRSFAVRGLPKVNVEFALTALAYNLRHLHRLTTR